MKEKKKKIELEIERKKRKNYLISFMLLSHIKSMNDKSDNQLH
jgi:hypothetical protein